MKEQQCRCQHEVLNKINNVLFYVKLPKRDLFYIYFICLCLGSSCQHQKHSSEDLDNEIKDIKEKNRSISQTAKCYSIPRKTLADKKNNRRNSDKVGHPTVLTPEEENELKNDIFYMLSHVFPLNLKHKALLWL